MPEINEPIWVGMDVDAELARYEREDRRRAEEQRASAARGTKGLSLRSGDLSLCAPLVGKEAPSPQPPLVA